MECFLTVLKSIGFVIAVYGGGAIFIGSILAVAAATAYLVGVAPASPWFMAIFMAYLVVGMGTAIGIAECHS